MSKVRERAEEDAARRFPFKGSEPAEHIAAQVHHRYGFTAGRAADSEQVEQAAVKLYLSIDGKAPWLSLTEQTQQGYRNRVSDLFSAAGFIVEEETP